MSLLSGLLSRRNREHVDSLAQGCDLVYLDEPDLRWTWQQSRWSLSDDFEAVEETREQTLLEKEE